MTFPMVKTFRTRHFRFGAGCLRRGNGDTGGQEEQQRKERQQSSGMCLRMDGISLCPVGGLISVFIDEFKAIH